MSARRDGRCRDHQRSAWLVASGFPTLRASRWSPPGGPRLPRCDVAEQPLDGGIANAGNVVRVGPHVLRPSSRHTGHPRLPACRGRAGSRAPRSPSASTRTDASASCSSTVTCPGALSGLEPVRHRAGFDRPAAARAARRRPHVRRQGLTWRQPGRPGGWDARVPQRRGALERRVPRRRRCRVARLRVRCPRPPCLRPRPAGPLCVPIDDDVDQARIGWRPADLPARLRLVADAYGLDRDGRAELLSAWTTPCESRQPPPQRRRRQPERRALWDRTGGSDRFDRRRRWWAEPRPVRRRPPLTPSSAGRGVARMGR